MVTPRRFLALSTVIGGLFAALILTLTAAPAAAFPSSTPNAAWPTAKVDAQLKPRFGDLIGVRHHGYYSRPSWSRWRNFYYRGSCGGYGSSNCGGGYQCGPQDPYCQSQGQCDPQDPYCQSQGQCDPADPYCSSNFIGYQGGYQQGGYQQGYPGGSWVGQPLDSWGGVTVYGGGERDVTVDCRQERRGAIREALDRLADGGTLHLVGKGPACTETLQISRPVLIMGDAPRVFANEADAGPAVLSAPPGAPCAVIDAGPRSGVEFRNLIIDSPQGGRSACIQTFSSAVALIGVTVRYSGESSALYIQGGRLITNDADINSGGLDATIWSEDADISMTDSHIVAATTGIDARPGIGEKIILAGVGIDSTPGGDSGPMSGIIGRRSRGGGCQFVLNDVHVDGFRTGLLFEGGLTVDATHIHITNGRMGVAVDGANVNLKRADIFTTEFGVYRYGGSLSIEGGSILSLTRAPVGWDGGPAPEIHGLNYYGDGCDRGGFWTCHRRLEAPSWLERRENGVRHHWGY